MISSEQAGTPTHSGLDREKAEAELWRAVDWLGWGDDEKGDTADRPEMLVRAVQRWLDRLEACVVPDPRLVRIEALLDDETLGDHLYPEDIRAILRGDQ